MVGLEEIFNLSTNINNIDFSYLSILYAVIKSGNKASTSRRGRSSSLNVHGGIVSNESLQLLASESAKKRAHTRQSSSVPRFDDFELLGFNAVLDQSGVVYGGDNNGLNVSNFSDMSAVFSIDGPSPSPIAGDVGEFVDSSPNFDTGTIYSKAYFQREYIAHFCGPHLHSYFQFSCSGYFVLFNEAKTCYNRQSK